MQDMFWTTPGRPHYSCTRVTICSTTRKYIMTYYNYNHNQYFSDEDQSLACSHSPMDMIVSWHVLMCFLVARWRSDVALIP